MKTVANGSGSALPDQLITRAMLRKLVPVSDMALHRWRRRWTFPQPIKFNGRNYWRLSEITAWLERNAALRVPAQAA